MAIVFETFVNNWAYVGGATSAYILTPETVLFFDNYIEFLFALILFLALMAIALARHLKISRIGQGWPRSATTSSRRNAPACRPCA